MKCLQNLKIGIILRLSSFIDLSYAIAKRENYFFIHFFANFEPIINKFNVILLSTLKFKIKIVFINFAELRNVCKNLIIGIILRPANFIDSVLS